jgi:hypothetical protein
VESLEKEDHINAKGAFTTTQAELEQELPPPRPKKGKKTR